MNGKCRARNAALCLLLLLQTAIPRSGGAEVSRSANASPSITAALESLHRTIMLRTGPGDAIYGASETDPLLWWASTHLRTGEAREQLIGQLEAIGRISDDEVRRAPAAQRALLQNRLWAVFDFVHQRQNEAPQGEGAERFSAGDEAYLRLLARAMGKLALSEAEIASIPDPLEEGAKSGRWPSQATPRGGAEVFLPSDLSLRTERWTLLGRGDGAPIAPVHLKDFGGRSSFHVLAKFPESAPSPAAYFKATASVAEAWRPHATRRPVDGMTAFALDPDMPVLPNGAQFALVRRIMVIDRQGQVRATPLTLSVQLRHYWSTSAGNRYEPDGSASLREVQSVAEFQLDAEAVAAGAPPRLRAIAPDEKGFSFFQTHGNDQLEHARDGIAKLRSCVACHSGPGLASLNSVMGVGGAFRMENRIVSSTRRAEIRPPFVHLAPQSAENEVQLAAAWKTQQRDWLKLTGLWPKP